MATCTAQHQSINIWSDDIGAERCYQYCLARCEPIIRAATVTTPRHGEVIEKPSNFHQESVLMGLSRPHRKAAKNRRCWTLHLLGRRSLAPASMLGARFGRSCRGWPALPYLKCHSAFVCRACRTSPQTGPLLHGGLPLPTASLRCRSVRPRRTQSVPSRAATALFPSAIACITTLAASPRS